MKAIFLSQWRMMTRLYPMRLLREASTLIIAVAVSLSACVPPGGIFPSEPALEGTEQSPVTGQSAAQATRDYLIGPEDLLFISVWQEPDLQREVRVRPDGGISFPLAGNVQVAGKSVQEVTGIITQRVQKYIPAAVVTVSVQQVAGYNIFVIGQVNRPGQFRLGRYVDVMQALTLAGGLTPFANADDITIRRRTADGQERVFEFDYGAVQSGDNMEQNIVLQSGDVVVVP
jgi:polysaccharide export outer membrane protein